MQRVPIEQRRERHSEARGRCKSPTTQLMPPQWRSLSSTSALSPSPNIMEGAMTTLQDAAGDRSGPQNQHYSGARHRRWGASACDLRLMDLLYRTRAQYGALRRHLVEQSSSEPSARQLTHSWRGRATPQIADGRENRISGLSALVPVDLALEASMAVGRAPERAVTFRY